MNSGRVLFSMLKADFLERTRRSSFLVTVCLVIYLGYAVNTGQILIRLDSYRGIYNSAWVGSLMALVITFFLGLTGFYLVKNALDRDERTGVGQIIATTPITRAQYLLGKWLSNFAVLAALVGVLALGAVLMQVIQHEEAQLHLWPLIAPLLFIALPMMALVAALALLFESISFLKGGFGNLVYLAVFLALFTLSIFLSQFAWLDPTGIALIGNHMKAAAAALFPGYNGSFTLSMAPNTPLTTFVWEGIPWSFGLVLPRLAWLVVSVLLVLVSVLPFNRFDPSATPIRKPRREARSRAEARESAEAPAHAEVQDSTEVPDRTQPAAPPPLAALTPLPAGTRPRDNFLRLVWLESLLLVKGLKWYWLAGMALVWVAAIAAPDESARQVWFMLALIWPVLVWSQMGVREARFQTEQLVFQAARPLLRLLAPAWLAGVLLTALLASGVLLGRLFVAEPLLLLAWVLSVLFIPSLALVLGVWSRTSKLFEVVYPILWYLGPFNRDSGIEVLDFLGIHPSAPVNTAPLWFAALIVLLLALAVLGRRRQLLV